MGLASQSGMYFADAGLRDLKKPFFPASFTPSTAGKLFTRSGHSFEEVAALADASAPVPGFALRQSLRAEIATRRGPVRSANIVGMLPGSDPDLLDEHVVLTAHLDHLGIGEPINGDPLFNGALDNAAGVSSLLDIARSFRERHVRPRRSILFVIVTAEEKGLLGSHYFARRPSVEGPIVADLNLDMMLPIFPLRSVIALGADESSLGADARAVGAAMGLPIVPDPNPERNSFIRADQYSFISEGIPSLAFKFGFAKGSPEAALETQWRTTRYHAPSDDLNQPVEKEDAVRLNDLVGAIALRVANAEERPAWLAESFFKRFAK
jgi:Zn-dependent M28 family amino/carboxypeptidase